MTCPLYFALVLSCVPAPPPALAALPTPASAVSPRLSGPPTDADFAGPRAYVPEPDPWLAEDKAQHLAMSFAVTAMGYGAARAALDPGPARRGALTLAAVLGIGKELMDVRRGGPFGLKDLVFDAAGAGLGFLFIDRIQ